MIAIMADSAGNSAGIGREIIFSDSLNPGDPFCTVKRVHISFCGDFEPNRNFGKI